MELLNYNNMTWDDLLKSSSYINATEGRKAAMQNEWLDSFMADFTPEELQLGAQKLTQDILNSTSISQGQVFNALRRAGYVMPTQDAVPKHDTKHFRLDDLIPHSDNKVLEMYRQTGIAALSSYAQILNGLESIPSAVARAQGIIDTQVLPQNETVWDPKIKRYVTRPDKARQEAGKRYLEYADDAHDRMLNRTQNAQRMLDENNVNLKVWEPLMRGNFVEAAQGAVNTFVKGMMEHSLQMATAATVGPLASSALMGLSVEEQKYAELRHSDLPEWQKNTIAILDGTWEFVFEHLSTEQLFKKMQMGEGDLLKAWAKDPSSRNMIIGALKSLLIPCFTEGSEEFVTEWAQQITDYLGQAHNKEEFKELAKDLKRKGIWKNILNQAIEAGIAGGLIGLGMAGKSTFDQYNTIQKFQNASNYSRAAFNYYMNKAKEDRMPAKYASEEQRREALDDYLKKGKPITFDEPTPQDWYRSYVARLSELEKQGIDMDSEGEDGDTYRKIRERFNAFVQTPEGKAVHDQIVAEYQQRIEQEAAQQVQQEQQEQPVEPPAPVEQQPVETPAPVEQPKENKFPTKQKIDPKSQYSVDYKPGETKIIDTKGEEAQVAVIGDKPQTRYYADEQSGVKGHWAVVDANALEISNVLNNVTQNRDMSTKQSREMVAAITNGLKNNPSQTLDSRTVDHGAPTVIAVKDKDGNTRLLVHFGNHRAQATINGYSDAETGQALRSAVTEYAQKNNIDITGIQNPMLVFIESEAQTVEQLQQGTQRGNHTATRQMTPSQNAQSDALLLAQHPEVLKKFIPGGNLSTDNFDFLRDFMQITDTMNAGLLDEKNRPTMEAENRVARAMFAYFLRNESPERQERMLKSVIDNAGDNNIVSLVRGIMSNAPALAQLEEKFPDYAIGKEMINALDSYLEYKRARSKGEFNSIENWFNQTTMDFGDKNQKKLDLNDVEKDLARIFDKVKTIKGIRTFFNTFTDTVHEEAGGEGLFSDVQKRTKAEIIHDLAQKTLEPEEETIGTTANASVENESTEHAPRVESARVADVTQENATPEAVQEKRKNIDDAVRVAQRLFPNYTFKVYDKVTDLPENIRNGLPNYIRDYIDKNGELPEGIRVEAANDGMRTIHILADQMPSDPAAIRQRIMSHEIVGHDGLKQLLGKRYDKMLDSVYADHENDIIPIANRYHYAIETVEGRRNATEEWLAHNANIEDRPSWFNRLVAKIRATLRVMFNIKWSDNDIRSCFIEAARNLQEQSGSQHIRFAISGQTNGRYTLANAVPSKKGYRVERVNETCGSDLNNANGVICEQINQIFTRKDAPSSKFKAWITDKISNFMSSHGLLNKLFFTPALGDNVKLSDATANSLGNHGGPDAKYNIIPVIPDMLRNAVLIQTEAHTATGSDTVNSYSHLLASKVRYGQDERYIAVMVVHDNNGRKYYDHSIMLINEADILNGDPSTSGPSSSASVLNVARKALLSSGFDKNSDNNIKFSLTEQQRQQINTPEFKRWFGDSQAVDSEGNPLVVYRRDNERFNIFDFNKTQQTDAGWLGKGFYFYGDKNEAERSYAYGKNLRQFFLRAENPYYITEEEYNELVEANDKEKSAEFTQRLIDEGYDSVYWNGDLRQEWVVFEPTQIKSATDNVGTFSNENPDIHFSLVSDAKVKDEFQDSDKYIETYRSAMLGEDGKLYPPMATKGGEGMELGQVYRSDEHPEKINKKGKFPLKSDMRDSGKQGNVDAAYNPYFHSQPGVLNDQFSVAYDKSRMVTVKCRVLKSDLESGYWADGAKDPVGYAEWDTSGPVTKQLRHRGGRTVILSRYIMPVEIVPDSEVARMIKEQIGDEDVTIPWNVVPQNLRNELVKAGVKVGTEEKFRQQEVEKNAKRKKNVLPTKGEVDGGIRWSIKTFPNGKKYVKVDTDQAQFDGLNADEAAQLARKIILEKYRNKIIGVAPDNAFVNRRSAEEYAYPAKSLDDDLRYAKSSASPELDNLMLAGRNRHHEADDGHHPEATGGWDYYDVTFQVGEDFFEGKINVMITDRGRRFHDVTDLKKDTSHASGSRSSQDHITGGVPTNILPTKENASQEGEENKSGDGVANEAIRAYFNNKGEKITQDSNQLEFDFDYEQREETLSEGERSSQEDARRDATDVLRRCGGTLLGLGITKDFKSTGVATLVGRRITSPTDLADAAQIFRNPHFETFRYVFVKNNEVVYANAVTLRMPGATKIFTGDNFSDFIHALDEEYTKAGADGYYLLHNHPSGNVTISGADYKSTRDIRTSLNGKFLGHVVINHNKYSLIDRYGNTQTNMSFMPHGKEAQYDPQRNPSLAHPMLGTQVKTNADIAVCARQIQQSNATANGSAVLFGMSPQLEIKCIATIPLDDLGQLSEGRIYAMARQLGRISASSQFFLANVDSKYADYVLPAVRSGLLLDAVLPDGTSIRQQNQLYNVPDILGLKPKGKPAVTENTSDVNFSLTAEQPTPGNPDSDDQNIYADHVAKATAQSPIENLRAMRLPLILELARKLKGDVKAVDGIPIDGARGVFYHGSRLIEVLRELAKPQLLEKDIIVPQADVARQRQLWEDYWTKAGVPLNEIEIVETPVGGDVRMHAIRHDRTLARFRKTAAHEVGHLIDYNTGETTSHGNVLGTVGGMLKGWLMNVIGETPSTQVDKTSLNQLRRQLHKQAETMAGPKPKPADKAALDAWRQAVSDKYHELVVDECDRNAWFRREVVREEMVDLTRWWSGEFFGENPSYVAYRQKPTELFAETMSVLLNAPDEMMKRSPETWRLIQNYQSNKPEFHKAWRQLMDLMNDETAYAKSLLEIQRRGFDAGEVAALAAIRNNPSFSFEDSWMAFKRSFVNKFANIADASKQVVRNGQMVFDDTPLAAITAAQHASVKDYYMKMANRLAQPLLDMGLTEKDIGLYMQNKRIENDPSLNDTDRGILNPNGLTAEDATLILDELHRQLGNEKWNALEQWHKDFWQLRQETIIQMMEDSGAYSQELLDHVRDNEWYAYRKIISTLYGKDGAAHDNGSAKIYGLKGTVSDAANPLSWTFENDLRIMGGILWNTARMRTVDLMQQFFPNMVQKARVEGQMTNGRLVMKDAPDGFTRMYVLREGKLEQWDVADAFAVGFSGVVDEDLYSLMSGLSKVTNWFRMGWTTYSPTFFVNNVIRDYLSTYQNFTEKNSPGLLQWTKYWALGMKEAFGDEFGWTSAVIDEMERQNMFQSAQQGHGEIIRRGTELSRLMDKYQLLPTKQTIKQRFLGDSMNPFKMLATLMEHLVSATERGAKAGGYMAMQDRMSGLSTDEMRYHVVKHIGSPDFATRGTKTFVTNTLFVFSNAAIQGWSATLESAKANPRAYGMRWMATTGVATLLGWAMSSGALLAALRGMGMDDDDDLIKFLEWMKKMYGKITHYNRFNYACLPIGETDDGQAVYIRIPYAENSRVSAMIFNGMLEAAYNETPKSYGAFTETARAVGSMATNTNPIIAALLDLAMFGQGYNIYDRHYGRPKVKTEDFNAGGLWRAKGIGSYMYREYSPYNFLKWDPENPNFWYDLIGTTLGWGTLVRKSSAGEKEAKREQRKIKANEKVRAKKYRPF